MGRTFRESMAWLHTWAGVVLGALLVAIFWMGTLAVFDQEIDRWMMPETRIAWDAEAGAGYSHDAALDAVRRQHDLSRAQILWFERPSSRLPVTEFRYLGAGAEAEWRGPFFLDPRTHERLSVPQTDAGTGFLYPFHYSLHLRWMNLGYWLVGLAAMAMLVLLVSGVVIHRKIFVDFFTFRRERRLPRSSLDLHNLTGVLGLPFHFVITLSGLIIFYGIYFPSVEHTVFGDDRAAFSRDAVGTFQREPAGEPGSLASLDAMAAEATRIWGGDPPWFMRVWHPGDANATVEMRRTAARSIDLNADTVHFASSTGDVLHTHTAPPVVHVQRYFAGLHLIQFDHWPLRWIYFVLGLSGCVMIATGYVYWLEARRKKHAALGLPGVRIVEGLTVGSVTGIVIATLAFFVVNRLLPLNASFAGAERAALEVWTFYLVWLATFAHAWARPGTAGWREQCGAIATLALLAPVLNWTTTGDHLIETVSEGYWPVAGMDLLLLIGAATAGMIAWRLYRCGATKADQNERDVLEAAE